MAVKTKEKILATALKLFNNQGVANVSSRNISDAVGISYGNLCYHFPKKSDLVKTLYLNLQKEIDQQLDALQSEIMGFDFMARSVRVLLTVLFKYQFVFIDLTNLVRIYPEIREHATKQFESRKKLLRKLLNFLLIEEILEPEKMDGHYDMAIHNLLLVMNFCMSDSAVFYTGPESDKIDYYLEMFYNVVRAHLTKKGLKVFLEVYSSEKNSRADETLNDA